MRAQLNAFGAGAQQGKPHLKLTCKAHEALASAAVLGAFRIGNRAVDGDRRGKAIMRGHVYLDGLRRGCLPAEKTRCFDQDSIGKCCDLAGSINQFARTFRPKQVGGSAGSI